MSSFSTNNDFETILKRLLDRIPNNLDKRQGSIIFDALAPAAAELAQCYIALDVYADQTYLDNAIGENLDNRAADYGVERNQATFAQRIGEFKNNDGEPMSISIGTRFSIPTENGGYIYKIIEEQILGRYIMQCETAGTVGNLYFGDLLPLISVNNLGEAKLTDLYIAGEDVEDDESLRARTKRKIRETPYGGNVAEYRQYVEGLDGIGYCLVIPVWNGGGTVKLIPITNSLGIPTRAKIDEIQTLIDPTSNQGKGLGKAPIGHIVTVVPPTKYDINIETTINIDSLYTLDSLREDINKAINNYIEEIQMNWAYSDMVTIYNSRLIASIFSVKGIVNVENLTINGSLNNLTLYPTQGNNPYPILNEVILHEG